MTPVLHLLCEITLLYYSMNNWGYSFIFPWWMFVLLSCFWPDLLRYSEFCGSNAFCFYFLSSHYNSKVNEYLRNTALSFDSGPHSYCNTMSTWYGFDIFLPVCLFHLQLFSCFISLNHWASALKWNLFLLIWQGAPVQTKMTKHSTAFKVCLYHLYTYNV